MSKHSPIDTFADADETEVRDLLASAGPRPAVPSEDLAKLQTVAKERWLEMVEIERERARFGRRTTMLALAASLLMAIALGWWLMPNWGGAAPDVVASVELVRGEVLVDGALQVSGGDLVAGAVVTTGPEASGAALRLTGAHSVRLARGSRLRLVSPSRLELERGTVYVDTHGAAPRSVVEVSTPFGVVHDIGTQFLIRVDEQGAVELTVQVREGEVVLEAEPGKQTAAAAAGEKLILRRAGGIEKVTVDSHGESWGWIGRVTPPMDIEGVPLSDYLEWVSRETGRSLSYADASLAQSVKSIRLYGSIEGMTPEQSLEILPGSGLGHRIENGRLLIEQP